MVYEQIADQAYREWQESTRLQLGQLLAPAQTEERPGPGSKRLTYISHYHAFANMNEVFGFEGWSSAIMDVKEIQKEKDAKNKWTVVVQVIVRVTIIRSGNFHDGIATDSSTGPEFQTVYDNATKSATTQAHKIAFKAFGNYTGLCLYNDTLVKRIKTQASTDKRVPPLVSIPVQNLSGVPVSQMSVQQQNQVLLQTMTPVMSRLEEPLPSVGTVVVGVSPKSAAQIAQEAEDQAMYDELIRLGY